MGVQKLFVGDQLIETEIQKRKIVLGGYLTLLYLGADLFYFVVNLFNPQGEPITLLIGFLIAGVCLFLIRKGHINWALVIQLLRANTMAFYFSLIDEDPYTTAPFIYFIPSSLAALSIFGYHERWKGILFTLLSLTLFLVAMLEPRLYTPEKAHFYFISNFVIVLFIGAFILVFYDQLAFESEQKITEQNKALLKANAELDRFVYSVSHDLRAPLASILGLINVYSIGADNLERDKLIDLIQGRVIKLDMFIQEILDYSRNARMSLTKEELAVEEFLHSLTDGMQYMDGTERIKIQVKVPPSFKVVTDPKRLKVIVNNLLTNAIRYADLQKRDPYVVVEAHNDSNGWILRVRDNGVGIKKEYQQKVFEMFYQASNHAEGSGLGLYIVKEAVELLDGKIELQSTFGEGTEITVSFQH